MFLKENQAANSIVNYGMFILVQLREIQYPRFAISYRNRNRVLKLWFSLILVWNCSYFLTYVQCGSAYVPVVFIYFFSFHFSFIQNFHWHPKPKRHAHFTLNFGGFSHLPKARYMLKIKNLSSEWGKWRKRRSFFSFLFFRSFFFYSYSTKKNIFSLINGMVSKIIKEHRRDNNQKAYLYIQGKLWILKQ